ncbi:MAG: hypothetical protein C7B47_17230, partial [Sulfobacillus thermosulfidooxidans]
QEAALDAIAQACDQGIKKPVVVLPTGTGKCIVGRSWVLTHKGIIPIQAFAPSIPETAQEISLRVWGCDGPEVSSHIYYDGQRPTIKIRSQMGFEVEGTRDHRILVRNEAGEEIWKPLKAIQPGDVLVVGRGMMWFPQDPVPMPQIVAKGPHRTRWESIVKQLPKVITPEFGRFMALLIADGNWHQTQKAQFPQGIQYTKRDETLLQMMMDLITSWNGHARVIREEKKAPTILWFSVYMARLLLALGMSRGTAQNKVIPWSILQSPRSVVQAFLQALFDGDGYVNNNYVEYVTASATLAEQMHILLLNFGIVARKFAKVLKTGPYAGRTYWRLTISGSHLKPFAHYIGFSTPTKAQRLQKLLHKKRNPNRDVVPYLHSSIHKLVEAYQSQPHISIRHNYRFVEAYANGYRQPTYQGLTRLMDWCKTVDLQQHPTYQTFQSIAQHHYYYDIVVDVTSGEAPVYDFVVPSTHSFWANGFINHNTMLFAELIRRRRSPALVLAHRDELVRQAADKIQHVWPEASVGIVKGAEDQWEAPIVVASVQSLHAQRLHRWPRDRFATVVVDECFPAGTLVDGRPIETWQPGEILRAFDPDTHRWVSAPVIRIHHRSTTGLMQITLNTSEILRCTCNHPFYTREGWIEAEFLQPGDSVLGRTGWVNVVDAMPMCMATPVDVFNLDVAFPHTYSVGQAGIVVHNCHHAPAPSYRKILDYLQPDLLLGVSATPFRTDLTSLETVFDKIVYSYGIREAIQDGWLVDIQAVRVQGSADLDAVATRGGDFVEGQLQVALNSERRNALIVTAYQTHTPDTKAIVFCAGVQHAHDLARMFQQHNIPAAAVDGGMDLADRRRILQSFHDGSIRVLTNAQLATEGYNEPSIETVILARPTKSLALFTQMVGRGTRPAPGKDHMILIDIADNTRRHKIISVRDLLGLRRELPSGTRVSKALAREARLSAPDEEWLTLLVPPDRLHSEHVPDLFLDLMEETAPTVDWRDIADALTEIAEDPDSQQEIVAQCQQFGMINPDGPSTPLQQQRLQEFGWPASEAQSLPKWAASWVLDRHREALQAWTVGRATRWADLLGTPPRAAQQALADALWKLAPATPKQKAWLRRHGTPEALIEGLTKGEASWLIDRLPRQ